MPCPRRTRRYRSRSR